MPKIDIGAVPAVGGSSYPEPHATEMGARVRQALGDAAGLTQFGVNLLTLKPGVWSSQRHWHRQEYEFVYILSGEAVLVTDAGEEVMRAGDCAAFPAGEQNGHHLINRSAADVVLLEIGTRTGTDTGVYSDIDMLFDMRRGFSRKDGTSYERS